MYEAAVHSSSCEETDKFKCIFTIHCVNVLGGGCLWWGVVVVGGMAQLLPCVTAQRAVTVHAAKKTRRNVNIRVRKLFLQVQVEGLPLYNLRPIHTRNKLTDELTKRIDEFIHQLNQCTVPLWECPHLNFNSSSNLFRN